MRDDLSSILLPARNSRKILARVEETLPRRAPALRCLHPGQAGVLKADSNAEHGSHLHYGARPS